MGKGMAFRAQLRVNCHRAVVREGALARDARLAGFAASVVRSFQVTPAMSEFRGRFVLTAGGASVWPSLRRAVVAHPATFRVLAQLAALECLVTHAADSKEVLLV